jgi:site-specific DNA recombinase
MTQKRAALYARVSTDTQAKEGYSLAEQIRLNEAYCERKGYVVVERYADDISGETIDRPAMRKALDRAARKEIDVLVVLEMDRFAREPAPQYILQADFARYGVEIEFVNEDYGDGSDPMQNFRKLLAVGIASLERQHIKERSRRGKNSKARENKLPFGTAPYGYTLSKPDGLKAHPDEAWVVQQIFKWYVEDRVGMYAIRNRLLEQGISSRTGGVWPVSTISKILKNTVYAGYVLWGKTRIQNKKRAPQPSEEWIRIDTPVLVPPEMFEAAAEQCKSNVQQSKRNTRHPYLLRGFLICGGCGRRYNTCGFNYQRGGGYYRCNGNSDAYIGACTNGTLNTVRTDALVWGTICEYLDNPDAIGEAIDHHNEDSAEKREVFEQRRTSLERELANVERQMRALVDLFLDSKVPKDILDQKQLLLTRQKADYERQLTQLATPVLLTKVDKDTVLNVCAKLRKVLPNLDLDKKREVLRLLNVEVVVNADKSLCIKGLLPGHLVPHHQRGVCPDSGTSGD